MNRVLRCLPLFQLLIQGVAVELPEHLESFDIRHTSAPGDLFVDNLSFHTVEGKHKMQNLMAPHVRTHIHGELKTSGAEFLMGGNIPGTAE